MDNKTLGSAVLAIILFVAFWGCCNALEPEPETEAERLESERRTEEIRQELERERNPFHGQTMYLHNPHFRDVLVARNGSDVPALSEVRSATQDRSGLPPYFTVNPNTRVEIIGMEYDAMKIEVLDGKRAGEMGFAALANLSKGKVDVSDVAGAELE